MNLDHFMEQYDEARRIRCPYCQAIFNTEGFTDNPELVTYWGEDEPVELECLNEECERTFLCAEHVERTFTTGKTLEEANR